MDFISKIITKKKERVLILLILVFLINTNIVKAEIFAPFLSESDWRTGEIVINYDFAIDGATINIYTNKWDTQEFELHDSFVTETESGIYVTQYFENGQSIWFYITQTINGVESGKSYTFKQTPPITAYIINWPEMMFDLNDAFGQLVSDLNDAINGAFERALTPSDDVINDLTDAINDLKDALGVGAVEGIANDLTGGLSGIGGNLNDPIVTDDGVNTYTGGSTGGASPFEPGITSGGDLELTSPDLDSGTDTDLTLRIPLTQDFNGEMIFVKLFTSEQMDKYMWLDLMRNVATAAIWILFGIWAVTRFTPMFKT